MLTSSSRLEDAFYSENVLRETTERERVRKNFIRVVVKTERRFRRTHTSDQREEDEDQRDALKSFVRSETSADREERVNFLFARRENNDENNNKARKKGRRSREKRGVLREINRIFKSLSPLLSVFSWRGGRRSRRFFFEKKTLEAKKEERKRKRKRNIIAYEKAPREDLTVSRAAAKVAAFVSRIIFVSRIRRL